MRTVLVNLATAPRRADGAIGTAAIARREPARSRGGAAGPRAHVVQAMRPSAADSQSGRVLQRAPPRLRGRRAWSRTRRSAARKPAQLQGGARAVVASAPDDRCRARAPICYAAGAGALQPGAHLAAHRRRAAARARRGGGGSPARRGGRPLRDHRPARARLRLLPGADRHRPRERRVRARARGLRERRSASCARITCATTRSSRYEEAVAAAEKQGEVSAAAPRWRARWPPTRARRA